MTDDDPPDDDIEQRVTDLERTVRKMLPTRRDALGAAGAALLGGGLVHSTSNSAAAGTQNTGTVGTTADPVDLVAEDFTDHNGNDVMELPGDGSVSIDVLNTEYEFIHAGTSISNINSTLSSPGTYIFVGDHSLSDQIKPTADFHIIVPKGASVGFADSASPSNNANLLLADGVSGWLEIYGAWQPNDSNVSTNTNCGRFVDASEARIDFGGSIDAAHGGFAVDDSTLVGGEIRNISNVTNSCLSCEGSTGEFGMVTANNVGEAVDLNGQNDGITIQYIYAEDVTEEAVDINESPNTEIKTVEAGSNVTSAVRITGSGSTTRTSKNAIGHCDDVTIDKIIGSPEKALDVTSPDNPVRRLTIGLDCKTDGASSLNGVNVKANGSNQFDDWTIRGSITATGGPAMFFDGDGYQQGSLELDVRAETTASNASGVNIFSFNHVSGSISTHGNDKNGVAVNADSGTTLDSATIEVNVTGCGGRGVVSGGSGTVNDVYVSGVVSGNSGTDLDVITGDVRFDGHVGSTSVGSGATLEVGDYTAQ